ncbi:hypothetical protein [Porphyromonas sp. COT-290 OH860]|uniref:hypothetical protein n=1 Tax=Porphyromonas sp. COT-290 OH860 TaxID=1515615 RepID=UPI00052DFFB7|nr:hypothetical protein [Porphyromonas sp. COT-290 OH860]KGN84868.1 hypothetical protein HQ41_03915 [Porphyromonas sp. COT-290 OH860]
MGKTQVVNNENKRSILEYVAEADDEVRTEQISQATQQFVHYDTPLFHTIAYLNQLTNRRPPIEEPEDWASNLALRLSTF